MKCPKNDPQSILIGIVELTCSHSESVRKADLPPNAAGKHPNICREPTLSCVWKEPDGPRGDSVAWESAEPGVPSSAYQVYILHACPRHRAWLMSVSEDVVNSHLHHEFVALEP